MAGAGFHLLRDGLHCHCFRFPRSWGVFIFAPQETGAKRTQPCIPWRGHPYFKPVFSFDFEPKARFVLNCRKVVCPSCKTLLNAKTALCAVSWFAVAACARLAQMPTGICRSYGLPSLVGINFSAQPKTKPLRASNVLPPGSEPGTLRLWGLML